MILRHYLSPCFHASLAKCGSLYCPGHFGNCAQPVPSSDSVFIVLAIVVTVPSRCLALTLYEIFLEPNPTQAHLQ